MAEAADGPDEVEETGWGLVVERPAVGSALLDGQMPLELFLRVVHVVGSLLDGVAGWDVAEAAEMVDEDEEAAEFSEDWELERCACLRGPGRRIWGISSWLIVVVPLVHVVRDEGG